MSATTYGTSCTKWGLTTEASGSPVAYLAASAPDASSGQAPFTASGGLLLQGLGGTASAYLWSATTSTITTTHVDHLYTIDATSPPGYTSEGSIGYLHVDATGGATLPLRRYVNTATGHHYYTTTGSAPAGFVQETTLGYLHPETGSGLTALYRHANASTGDYVLTINPTPPSGYVLEATLGYIHTSGTGEPIPTPLPHVQDLAYAYDAGGNITQITDAVGTASRTFSYDALNRLTQANGTFGPLSGGLPTSVSESYQYDAIGNFTSKAGIGYVYGDAAHPSAVTATTDGRAYAYDANGNTLNGAGRQFTWDADNRVAAVTVQGGNSAEFAYDHTGRRVRKTVNAATVTRYPFADYEIDPTGGITKRIAGAIKKAAGQRLFTHTDHLGGLHVVTDINGVRIQLVEYDPWGKISRSEGDADPSRRFTGQELDPETGLYYYGGRYYDPILGRFISPDPFVQSIANPQALNRYAYVLNDPVNHVDPSGFFFKSIGQFFKKIVGAIVGVVVGAVVTVASGGNVALGAAVGFVVGSTVQGAVDGGLKGAAAGLVSSVAIVAGAALAGPAGAIVGGAAGGAAAAAIQGTDVGKGAGLGALNGAIYSVASYAASQGAGFNFGSTEGAVFASQVANDFTRGFAAGTVTALATGRRFEDALESGALTGAFAAAGTQFNNVVGHTVGFVASGGTGPTWNPSDRVYYYDNTVTSDGAIAIGNVVTGSKEFLNAMTPSGITYRQHELGHVPQASAFGLFYLPLNALSQALSLFITGTPDRMNAFENRPLHPYPVR